MSTLLNVFPDYFSEQAVLKIKIYGKSNNYIVYRVCKYGKDTTVGFLNYYEEVIKGLKFVRPSEKANKLKKYETDIDSLSVSCYYLLDDIIYYYNVTLKNDYPERLVLEGIASSGYGLSQKTYERKPNKNNSHIDWWLYKDATPWCEFDEVKDERLVL